MNWLAHALLAGPEPVTRLGNLLADLVKGEELRRMPPAFLEGVRAHRAIDAYTDAHPLVARSRARLGDGYRHARGVIVDILYDHLLARDWARWSPDKLEDFTAMLYAQMREHAELLPAGVRTALDAMMAEDWLASYREPENIEYALKRVSQRLSRRTGREFQLEAAMTQFHADEAGFDADFEAFFPQLRDHARSSS